ncbi:multidrug effflux MFS transporter [Candidatus Jidaibacter acanthamoebae]|nr:multidrug effflux MFS transporter [Candidatus Jidaibacter acanthamoeba]
MKVSSGFITIILLCILAGAEVDLFVPSFPQISKQFQLTPFMVELTLSANLIAYCISSLAVGSLGDRYGRKVVMIWGLVVFILGSILCVIAEQFYIIILGRFLQGAGIAAPAILTYVLVSDIYGRKDQLNVISILNGVVTLAMAFAPILGSYVNLYYSWKGNFIVLLIFGIICLIMLCLFIKEQHDRELKSRNLELFVSYLPVLRSGKVIAFTVSFCFLSCPYWIFIGISPILYMTDFKMSLEKFGFYQGAMAVAFSTVSISSSYALKIISRKRMFLTGIFLCALSAIFILFLGIIESKNPIAITGALVLLSMGVVLPINILYYEALEIMEKNKGKIAAVILSSRLIFTAIGLEVAGYFHQGSFKSTAFIMVFSLTVSLTSIMLLIKTKLFDLDK